MDILHVMTQQNAHINLSILHMLRDYQAKFSADTHRVITSNPELLKINDTNIPVKYLPGIYRSGLRQYLQQMNKADLIFLHNNDSFQLFRLLFTPKKINRKTIWCVWGVDLYDYREFRWRTSLSEFLKMALNRAGQWLINLRARGYYAIGIDYKYDAIKVYQRFGSGVRVLFTPYLHGNRLAGVDTERQRTADEPLRVMVGHSAHPFLDHVKLLRQLQKFKEENIILCLVLAYGSESYRDEVIAEARAMYGENQLQIITDRMDADAYDRFLDRIDVAVFSQRAQAAMGTIYKLMLKKKKLYLDKEGIIWKTMLLENIRFDTIDQIKRQNFHDFSAIPEYTEKEYRYALGNALDEERARMWADTINDYRETLKEGSAIE